MTRETLTEAMVREREAMAIGDTPLTGNGFVQACRVVLGVRGWDAFVPCSVRDSFEAEERVAAIINARKGGG